MRQVFISYSSKDFAQAQAVRNVLEQNGITCWMAPADIPGGSNYTKEIPIAIKGCQAFVLMLSDNAQHSHWVLKELDSAVNAGKIILPFQLEDVPLSDEFNFLLTGAQRYDAYQKKTEALQMLVARIKAIIEASPKAAVPKEPAPQPEEPKQEPAKKPVFIMPDFKQPKKPQSKMASGVDALGIHVCPACGSVDVKEFPDQVKPREPKEHIISMISAVGMALLAMFLVLIGMFVLSEILYWTDIDPDVIEALYFAIPVLMIAGAVWGVKRSGTLVATWIRRQRIRSHITVTECRCNTCQKRFQSVTTDDAAGK